jgi:hypothetical protein
VEECAALGGGDSSFKKMGTVKTKFVQDLLEMGVAPILTDADVVWLRDPRDYFSQGTVGRCRFTRSMKPLLKAPGTKA